MTKKEMEARIKEQDEEIEFLHRLIDYLMERSTRRTVVIPTVTPYLTYGNEDDTKNSPNDTWFKFDNGNEDTQWRSN